MSKITVMKNNFATNLKRLRQDAKLTQIQLGEKLGLTQRKISYLESGKVEPDMDTLIDIADFFDVTTDSLLGVDD